MLLKRPGPPTATRRAPSLYCRGRQVFSGSLRLDLASSGKYQHINTQSIRQNRERIGVAIFGFFSRFCPPLSSSLFTQLTIIQLINFQQLRIGVAIRPERQPTSSNHAATDTAAVTQAVPCKSLRTLTRGGPAAESATSRALPEKPSP